MKNLIFCSKLLLMLTIIFTSCTNEEPVPTYTVNGNIDNTTNQPVEATVQLVVDLGGTAKYTTSANASGEYQFNNVEEGTYYIVVNFQGYNETSDQIEVTGNILKNMTILGSANISGTIINSQTGQGLSNATVSFYVNQSQSNPSLQVTTDSWGDYEITNGPTGTFSGRIEATGFFTRTIENVVFTSGSNDLDPEIVVEAPEQGEIRIVLTWGYDPSDLDSHITGPDGSDRFHVYYSNKTFGSDVNLDVDDMSSYGPETVTISAFSSGTYRYSVHNYSDQSTSGGSEIASSPAKVEVYNESGLQQVYNAPSFTGSGNTWRVFEISVSGSTATFNAINQYVQASSSSDEDTFKRPESGASKSQTVFDINEF